MKGACCRKESANDRIPQSSYALEIKERSFPPWRRKQRTENREKFQVPKKKASVGFGNVASENHGKISEIMASRGNELARTQTVYVWRLILPDRRYAFGGN